MSVYDGQKHFRIVLSTYLKCVVSLAWSFEIARIELRFATIPIILKTIAAIFCGFHEVFEVDAVSLANASLLFPRNILQSSVPLNPLNAIMITGLHQTRAYTCSGRSIPVPDVHTNSFVVCSCIFNSFDNCWKTLRFMR